MVTMRRPVMPEEIWVGVGGLVGWQGLGEGWDLREKQRRGGYLGM